MSPTPLQFNPTGRHLASASGHQVFIWRPAAEILEQREAEASRPGPIKGGAKPGGRKSGGSTGATKRRREEEADQQKKLAQRVTVKKRGDGQS